MWEGGVATTNPTDSTPRQGFDVSSTILRPLCVCVCQFVHGDMALKSNFLLVLAANPLVKSPSMTLAEAPGFW